jgi:flagellar hook-length control protein FliK
MTVSLPVTLPAPAVAGKAGSAAPGKGVASAPGLNGKGSNSRTEANEVAGMFAALVAALTQQMQPVQDAPTPQTGGEQTADLPTGEPIVAPFAGVKAEGLAGAPAADLTVDGVDTPEPTLEAPAPSADGAAEVADGEVEVVDAAVEAADETVIETDGAETTTDVEEPAVGRPADRPGTARATGRDERPTPPSGTIPATPAQPAHGTGPATPAVPASPAAKADSDVRPVAGLATAPAGPAPATPTETVAAPPPPPAPAADPHLQIARVVRPLRLGSDGAYELALDLTPAELGRVRIDVELRGATIHLSLRADNPATRELLHASLDQLRAELESAGLQAGNLDIGGQGLGGQDSPGDDTTQPSPVSTLLDEEPAAAASATTMTSVTDTGVDVLA